jgi:type II secretory ATPase GspE/PulE/Tfp pilus assembly ATPase PilB-like protein
MKLGDAKIKDILLKGDYVTKEDIKKADEYAKAHHSSVIDYLLAEQLISPDLLGQALAEFYNVPYSDLNSNTPPAEQILKIPEDVARKHRVIIFKEDGDSLVMATDNPVSKTIVAKLKEVFPGKKIKLTYSLSEDIDNTFISYRKPLETRFAKIIKSEERIAPEIINEIFEDASLYRASDIHFEPQAKEVVIRFRIDGVLQEAGRIKREYYDNILNRIKVQAQLRTDEHASAQDGAIRYSSKGRNIDFRVSIIPTLDGEKVVMRILAEYVRGFSLNDIGLSANDQRVIKDASLKPFGMILVTGPTGSGKTTTLYAILKMLNRPEVNVTTIEDPVEYRVIGLNQIQVNEQTDLTFAKGLRSIVRQDPDVILVGEIRDEETAEIAVNAALTGHLLLSTFHANDAATSIPRLLDMGVEPFLLASTLEVIVAQRLVRKICEKCRHSYTTSVSELEKTLSAAKNYFPKNVTIYKGKGCNVCNNTGYDGRIAIFEFINITPKMQELILTNPSTKQIWELAKEEGSHALFEDGINKVKNGKTTLEELLRVAAPPYWIESSRKDKKK